MRPHTGFTLVELLVVITIIAILSAVGFTSYTTFVKNARDARRESDLKFIQSALEQYFADQKYYPAQLTPGDSLTFGGKTYLSKIPADPNNTANNYRYEARVSSCESSPVCDNATANKCSCYCLFVHMENQQEDKIEGKCSLPSPNYNFSLTRP